jgi:hypothetical protein
MSFCFASFFSQEEKEREATCTALASAQQEASKLTAQVATLSQKAAEAETAAASLKEQLQKVCAGDRCWLARLTFLCSGGEGEGSRGHCPGDIAARGQQALCASGRGGESRSIAQGAAAEGVCKRFVFACSSHLTVRSCSGGEREGSRGHCPGVIAARGQQALCTSGRGGESRSIAQGAAAEGV